MKKVGQKMHKTCMNQTNLTDQATIYILRYFRLYTL